MTNTSFDANVTVMHNYKLNVERAVGYKESVQKGDICLGFQGEKLVIVEDANSIFTKIKNLFLGIRLINQDILANNRRLLNHEDLRDRMFSKFFIYSFFKLTCKTPTAPFILGVNSAGLMLKVEYPDAISTKIKNLFLGISTNTDKVRSDIKLLDQYEFHANFVGNVVDKLSFLGIALVAFAIINFNLAPPSLEANC